MSFIDFIQIAVDPIDQFGGIDILMLNFPVCEHGILLYFFFFLVLL